MVRESTFTEQAPVSLDTPAADVVTAVGVVVVVNELADGEVDKLDEAPCLVPVE